MGRPEANAAVTSEGLGGRLVHAHDETPVYVFDEDIYVVECVGRICKQALAEVIEAIYARHRGSAPRAVLFFEAPGCPGYDRDVLTFYEADAERAQPGLVGVITGSSLVRMIVRAVGVGFRVFTHRTLAVYDDLPAALAAARARTTAG